MSVPAEKKTVHRWSCFSPLSNTFSTTDWQKSTV